MYYRFEKAEEQSMKIYGVMGLWRNYLNTFFKCDVNFNEVVSFSYLKHIQAIKEVVRLIWKGQWRRRGGELFLGRGADGG